MRGKATSAVRLREIANAHPDTIIGSYPFIDEDKKPNTNLVVRSRDPEKLTAAMTAVKEMLAGSERQRTPLADPNSRIAGDESDRWFWNAFVNASATGAAAPGKAFPVSWDQFHRDCRALTWRLNEVGPFHAIIAITRGGLVPAAIVARELGIRVIDTVCIASYDHTKQGDLKVLKGVSADIAKLGGGTGKGLLIVDDLVDTGKTGRLVRDDDAGRAFRHRLRQAAGPAAGRHLHHRSVAGHLDLSFPGTPRCRSSRRSATARRDLASPHCGESIAKQSGCGALREFGVRGSLRRDRSPQ